MLPRFRLSRPRPEAHWNDRFGLAKGIGGVKLNMEGKGIHGSMHLSVTLPIHITCLDISTVLSSGGEERSLYNTTTKTAKSPIA